MAEDITFTRERHLGLITLNRVSALNALTLKMILALEQQLQAWQNDEAIKAVIIQAAPGKAFCAGGDIRSLYEGRNDPQQLQFFWHEYRLNHFIHQFKKPYIALMDGVTMGGGVGISLHGSYPVASERFIFAMPETGIGFFPDIGASFLLTRCPGYLGTYLGLTGNRLGPRDAEAVGLVKHIIPSAKFPTIVANLLEIDLSKDAPEKVDHCLRHLAMPTEPAPLMELQPLIDSCFNASDMESIFRNLSKSDNPWHGEILDTLKQKSPLSLKVTLTQLQKAASMTMADCVKMDYCLVGHFMRDHDFYEGVRALIVDKDKTPHWQPASLSLATSAKVADYFECGQPELPLMV